jgi:Swt1-like HEPN
LTINEEERALARTNAAHDQLQRLERMLRKFIDRQMTNAFGPDWPQHQLPNGVFEKWREKRRTAEQYGAEKLPLIEYADFTEYEPLICRRDNWREVFGTIFKRQESVRECFQRLYPIRLDTMHARLITQDDELFLRVEIKRLVKVIVP